MTYLPLIRALKGGSGSGNFGHSGRPGKIGGSGANYAPMSNPASLSVIGDTVKRAATRFYKRRAQKLRDEFGLNVSSNPSDYDTRVPGIIDPKTGEMLVHKLTGSHYDMAAELLRGESTGTKNNWVDSVTRFGLVFDKDFKQVIKVQFHQGATGVDIDDHNFEAKSMKRIYGAIGRLEKLGVPSGTPVDIELEELDTAGHDQHINTTI